MTDPKMKIVYVKWIDSASLTGWRSAEQHKGPPPYIESAGYLLEKTDEYVTLLQSMSAYGNGDNSLTIPRCAIKRIRRVE